MGLLIAVTMYIGDFEERLKNLMEEVRQSDKIILFIDEVHTLIGAGVGSRPLDAANVLKLALTRGELQIAESMGGSEGLESLGTLDAGILDFIVFQQGINHVVSSVLIALGISSDIQRGITRIFHRTATPKEVCKVFHNL
ncbi:hypothetical protein Dimus_018079 [Dionaea muscipula]